ncbi:ATP-binding protein [Sphingobium nicotianae]|uniref:ATP-binding protein n=1 Tax=Sphingobium nicotianae TaxID=2782607 RepID=A0A9X1DEJ9_9SPHN|nr:ATP-binding protein [Sphingobium nicotianae]MBT2188103.1 ATP-binding protein [Sphingobium nicotianae]
MSKPPVARDKFEPVTLDHGVTSDPVFGAWLVDAGAAARGRLRASRPTQLQAIDDKPGLTLLAGASGTGRTLAAQSIARRLGRPVYRIDLASIASKYIGETEKALDRLFDATQAQSAILLLDEADALFGKRSEVRDAHDRYANIEVSYLLQRLEAYQGVVILAANARANLDPAFLRRLRHNIDFPSS